jgi:zinc/manganese transport system ATP-binding protein
LLRLLKQWNKEGKTIITVIHQLNLAKKFFENTILLNKKVIAKGDSQSVLSDDTLIRQAYTE